MRRLLMVLSSAACLLLAACGSSDNNDKGSSSTPNAGGATATQPPADATPTPTAATPAAGGCKTVKAPGPKKVKGKKPTSRLPKGKTFTVTLTTSCGKIAIRLDTKNDPKTAASFAKLAASGFYDGLSFVRVVPGFVIQGGDPMQEGTGGPGYTVVEPPPSDQKYVKGVVAMAKTGTEPPGASGSQFFIVTGDDAGLPPEYAVAGTVSSGQDVADAIGAIPPVGGQDGKPTQPVVISKATVSPRP